MKRKIYVVMTVLLVGSVVLGCSESKEQTSGNEVVSDNEEVGEVEEEEPSEDEVAIEDTLNSFFEGMKHYDFDEMKQCMVSDNVFKEGNYSEFWDASTLWVEEGYTVSGPWNKYYKENLQSIKYQVKNIVVDEDTATAKILLEYVDAENLFEKVCNEYWERNETSLQRENDLVAQLIVKYKDLSTTGNEKLEIVLKKQKDKWLIDNDVAFDKTLVDIMTCNNTKTAEEMYDYSDPSDAALTESGNGESIPAIQIGETVETKNYEFTLKKVELSYDVLPDQKSSYYNHYAADTGKVYIYVDVDIKNTGKQNLQCDDIYSVKADYNDGYTYDGFAIVDDSDMGFTYANISSVTPLETLGVPTLIDCPEEVETTDNPLYIIITMKDGSRYKYTIRG